MPTQLIEIRHGLPRYERFFGPWLCTGELNLLVDVGPAAWAEALLRSLAAAGVNRLDYVLLTHMHLDHAGGLARLLERYPMARVLCHEKGMPFLVDPTPLWEGSLKVLGEIAEAYGAPRPLLPEKLIPHPQNPIADLTVLDTPGHAAHHLSFVYQGQLFAGEAAGNFLALGDREYLRPATPPRFFLDVCLRSVERLLELADMPMRFAHYGAAEGSRRLLESFREQILLWERLIREEMQRAGGDLLERCAETLLARDPRLEAFGSLSPAAQERERFFMLNSIRGFLGYLKETP